MRSRDNSSPKTRDYIRCPCCGRLAVLPTGKTIPKGFKTTHPLDAKVQTFTGAGRGAGFAWEPRDLSSEETIALERVVSHVARRLQREVGAVADQSPSTRLAEENDRLRDENRQLLAALDVARGHARNKLIKKRSR